MPVQYNNLKIKDDHFQHFKLVPIKHQNSTRTRIQNLGLDPYIPIPVPLSFWNYP